MILQFIVLYIDVLQETTLKSSLISQSRERRQKTQEVETSLDADESATIETGDKVEPYIVNGTALHIKLLFCIVYVINHTLQ